MAKNGKKPLPRGGKSNNGTSQKKGNPRNQRPTGGWSKWSTMLDITPENAKKLLQHPAQNVREAARRYLKSLAALKAATR